MPDGKVSNEAEINLPITNSRRMKQHQSEAKVKVKLLDENG